ncbi:MAG TPA: hypothetical protein VGG37_03855, partial [Opitutaceae bacterium]
GSTRVAGDAEAVRLYAEADALVTNMQEKQYTYDYLQFYWKRAQSNVDRIRRVYPTSPTARALDSGSLKLGPYSLDYFKNRVLYNIELKRLGAFDDVNCAIFLYGRNEARSDPRRDEALSDIVEVLARRQRWAEALRFPVLEVHRPLLLGSIYRVAAFYGADDEARKIIAASTPAERAAAGFDSIQAEALALQGKPRADLYAFVEKHPARPVREAALRGVVEREVLIRRYERTRTAFNGAIQTVHIVVQKTGLRDDVPAVAQRLFPGDPDASAPFLAQYEAAEGRAPRSQAPASAHCAYIQFLADSGKMDAVASYVADNGLRGDKRRSAELKVIEVTAQAGQLSEAERLRRAFAPEFSPGADDAALAVLRGRMDSTAAPFEARRDSFADLPISDPCVMATAIMEWSLSPSRSQRGATPWDAVVARFAGGFDNLPAPKSAAVGDAASTLAPY